MILSQLTTLGKKSRLQSVHDESCIFRLKRYTLYATMRNYEGRNRTVPRRVSSPLGLVRIGGLFFGALMDAKTHLIVSQTTADATPASTEVKNSLIGFTSFPWLGGVCLYGIDPRPGSRIEGQGADYPVVSYFLRSCSSLALSSL